MSPIARSKATLDATVRAITELSIGPLIAILFWAIMGVIAVVAVAEGKDGHFTAVLTSFSAIGQVVVAYLLYRVTRDQFALNRIISEKQERIALREPRLKAMEQWRLALRNTYRAPADEDMANLYEAFNEFDGLFDQSVIETANETMRLFDIYFDLYQEAEEEPLTSINRQTKMRAANVAAKPFRQEAAKTNSALRAATRFSNPA